MASSPSVAGALDHRPDAGRAYGQTLGLAADRSYGDWREMLEGESGRDDRVDLVTIATPNATHFEIAKAYLSAGFDVLCEKPMTITVDEAEEIVRLCRDQNRICAVNYGYSGYALVRHMKAMVARGDLGRKSALSSRTLPTATTPTKPTPTTPASAGAMIRPRPVSRPNSPIAAFTPCTWPASSPGRRSKKLSADLVSCIASRELEDDAMVNFRMDGGTVGRLWTSSVAVGRQHGLEIQVYGEKGGLRWSQEHPNQLYYMPLGERLQVIERGEANLSPEADRATRVTIGHAEGMPLAFANIYKDLAEVIRARKEGRTADPAADLYPRAEDGLRSMAAIFAVAESGKADGAWVDARPPMFR